MPLETKTREELETIGRGAAGAFIDGADTSVGSDLDVSVKMNVALAQGGEAAAKHASLQIFPSSADDDFVLLHANARGASKAPAAGSRGRVLMVATSGTPTQADGSVLTAADGSAYKLDGGVTAALPGFTSKEVLNGSTSTRILVGPDVTGMSVGDPCSIDGQYRAIAAVLTAINAIDLMGAPLAGPPADTTPILAVRGAVANVLATSTGSLTNKEPGDTLTLSSPTSTWTAATTVLELSGGGDEETTGQLAQRLTAHFAAAPGAGNAAQIRDLARTTPDVRLDDAIVYLGYRGLGTVDVIPIGVAGARLVSDAVCALVQARLDAAFGSQYDILVLPFTYTATESALALTLTMARGAGPDFVGALTVGASTMTTTSIPVTADPRTTVEVGDRVLVITKPGWRYRTFVRSVRSIAYNGSFWCLAVDELPALPLGGESLYPGFASAQEMITALETYYESLGPGARSFVAEDFIEYEREPALDVAWPDTLRAVSIARPLLSIAGVLDVGSLSSFLITRPQPQEVIRPGKIILAASEE